MTHCTISISMDAVGACVSDAGREEVKDQVSAYVITVHVGRLSNVYYFQRLHV